MVAAAVLFLSPTWMATAGGLLVVAAVVAAVRRLQLGRAAAALIAGGGAAWTLAAGSPVWQRPAARWVAVMVDLSPSTRGAAYRDRATLNRRVAQLLGGTPYQLFAFAGGAAVPLPAGPTLPDVPCDRTAFAPPPPADAVLLFSDGRFDLPAVAPPTYPAWDVNLEDPTDAAVRQLEWTGDRVTARVAAPATRTALQWTGGDARSADVTGGGVVWTRATADEVTATVSAGDRWPENDRLAIRAPPPATAERWWVGSSPPPGWRALAPSALPTDPAAYLAVGAVVLDDVQADALSTEQQRRLADYVRSLGGGLVIGGGPRAFAAGGYGGTPLDAVSPLASDPPTPAERWVVLVDGSGSMAAGEGPGATPWRVECDAVARVLPVLPPADLVRVGSFADAVRWWTDDAPAADVAGRALQPGGVGPHGATNLSAALKQVAVSADASMLTHLLLMTDADADLPDAAALTAAMAAHHVRLHLLATGSGSALAALRTMVAATGGSVVEQSDPGQWVAAARGLARAAVPQHVVDGPTPVRWLVASGPTRAASFNRTWLRPRADLLAEGPDAPLAAAWSAGTGKAIAIGFPADAALLAQLADRAAAVPRDPRFAVTWTAGPSLSVSVDAKDSDHYLNGWSITLQLGDDGPLTAVKQTGPGLYQAAVPAPSQPTLATVRAAGRVIERFAVSGRYAPEFEAVGNDRAALAALAERTGGAVVGPGVVQPLTFAGPARRTDLAPWLATAGAAAVAAGLLRARRS